MRFVTASTTPNAILAAKGASRNGLTYLMDAFRSRFPSSSSKHDRPRRCEHEGAGLKGAIGRGDGESQPKDVGRSARVMCDITNSSAGVCRQVVLKPEREAFLPTSNISNLVQSVEKEVNASLVGGFSIVRRGLLMYGRRIAIKTLKLHHAGLQDLRASKVCRWD